MSGQAKDLAKRLQVFNDEVIAFVGNCSEEDWLKSCHKEEWTVGVTARHIAAGHYRIKSLAGTIIDGGALPEITPEEVVRNANTHAREHAGCTREEVLGLLKENGRALVDYVSGLKDEELARSARFSLVGGEISAGKFLETVILSSAGGHFTSMKEAVRG